MKEPNLYVIAGCNGAGKTTASFTILPEIIDCDEFINADEIARGLSPFNPNKVAFEAGRIMINRINYLLKAKKSFAFETTLSTKSYKNKIIQAKQNGYKISLIFFWLNSVKLAKKRVRTRVKEGGHDIPDAVISRRYEKGIINLFKIYLPIVDKAFIFDNSYGNHNLIAQKNGEMEVYNQKTYNLIKQKNYES